jgi:hypothetical protein
MNRISASAQELDPLFGRRGRHRSDARQGLRPAEREEPKLSGSDSVADPDMAEVIDKFERVHSGQDVKETEQVEVPERFSAVLADVPASLNHDTEDMAAALRIDVSPLNADTEAAPMRFDLPEADTIPAADPRIAAPQADPAQNRQRRRWPAIAGGVLAALVVGIGVGYMMTPESTKTSAARVQIETAGQSGARLRMDYNLPSP